MEARLRSRFVRTLIESIQVGAGSSAMADLLARLPDRLAQLLATNVLSSRQPTDSISQDDAEALLLEVDAILGDGSGRILEEAGRGLAARTLTEGGAGLGASDLLSAVRRLETPIVGAVVGAPFHFEVTPVQNGFVLTLGVAGRPRFARMLRHILTGYVRSAATGAGTSAARLTLRADTVGDRARISVEFGQADSAERDAIETTSTTPRRRTSATTKLGPLSRQIERILSSSVNSAQQTGKSDAESSSAPLDEPSQADSNEQLPPSRKTPR